MRWPTLAKIKLDFPDITFKKSDVFSWSPKTQTVFYKNLRQKSDFAQLLHEIAHAKLQHESYQRDITLIDGICDAFDGKVARTKERCQREERYI